MVFMRVIIGDRKNYKHHGGKLYVIVDTTLPS